MVLLFLSFLQTCSPDDLHPKQTVSTFYSPSSTCLYCHLCHFFTGLYCVFALPLMPSSMSSHNHQLLWSPHPQSLILHPLLPSQIHRYAMLLYLQITSQKYFYSLVLIIESRHSLSWVHGALNSIHNFVSMCFFGFILFIIILRRSQEFKICYKLYPLA